MRIERSEIESDPNVKGPHPNVGRLVITQEDERSHNLFARFVEDVWMAYGDESYSVGFSPDEDKATLWVSGESRTVVSEVLDEATSMLKRGFNKMGLNLEIVETDSSKD